MEHDDLPAAPGFPAVLEAALYAEDLDAAEAFYGGVLWMERIARVGDRHVFFRAGSSVVLIFTPARPREGPSNPDIPVPPHGAEGPGHLCLSAEAQGVSESRFPKMKAETIPLLDDSHIAMSVNMDACIGCGMCTHACLTEVTSIPIRPIQDYKPGDPTHIGEGTA